jgi:topoisomerase IA-like protein
MENKNIFLGKIEKNGCYLNDGKYGYFLTCNKHNYKLPEYLKPEEVTLDLAQRIIEYKKKIIEVNSVIKLSENILPVKSNLNQESRN